MKVKHYTIFTFAFGCAVAMAEDTPKAPPELNALKQRYQKDVESATKPIRERYLTDLKSLLRSTTQKGDFAGAIAVQNELSELSPKSEIARTLAGKWRFIWAGGTQDVTFRENGTFTTSRDARGKWVLQDDKLLLQVSRRTLRHPVSSHRPQGYEGPLLGRPGNHGHQGIPMNDTAN